MHRNKAIFGLLLFFMLFPRSSALALTKGFEAISFRPASDAGTYFSVWDAGQLKHLQWDLGTTWSYAYRPLQLINLAAARSGSILEQTMNEHFYGSMGIVDRWLQAGFEVPVGYWLKYTDPNAAGATAQNKFAVGDLQIHLKTQFLDPDHHHVGLSLLPFVSIPTGYGAYFYGNGCIAGGGKIIAEPKFGERFRMSVNAGIEAREKFTFRDIEKSNQLLFGLGAALNFTKNFSAVAELNGLTRLSDPFQERDETPLEAIAGLKYAFRDSGITISAGGGAGIIRGAGAPTARGFLGISYRSPVRGKKVTKGERTVSTEIIEKAVIHFAAGSTGLRPEDGTKLGEISDVLRENPDLKISVEGHTDSTGNAKYNQRLSKMRAGKVKWYIKMHSVDEKRMDTKGFGESRPLSDNGTAEGRAMNRRVEFHLDK